MSIDLVLTGFVVAGACFYVIRKVIKSGGTCAGGCNASSRQEASGIIDLRNKDL